MTETAIALLPSSADKSTWAPQQKVLMESLGLKGEKNVKRGGGWVKEPFEAPDSIVEAFIHQIHRTGLDPVARQIYCIERGGKWGIQISIDGFCLVAERSNEYRGQTPAQWSDGKLYSVPLKEDGKVVRNGAGDPVMVEDFRWLDVWPNGDTPPVAARVGIYRDGFTEPMWAVATYDGYVARNYEGKPTGQWETNPANQLAKCAEMLGLRKAFPQELSGLYGTEEMQQAGNPRGAAPEPARASAPPVVVTESDRDWRAEINSTKDLEALSGLAREAQQVGEWGVLIVAPAGEEDSDEPTKESVGVAMHRRKAELEAKENPVPEPLDGVSGGKAEPRDWQKEIDALTTSEDAKALHGEAVALDALGKFVNQLAGLIESLPSKEATPAQGWAASDDEPVEAASTVLPGSVSEPEETKA